MKKLKFTCIIMMLSLAGLAQDTITYRATHSQIFSLSPISEKVDKVNGLVLGVGHIGNSFIEKKTINGVNIEANPLGLLTPFMLVYSFEKKKDIDDYFKQSEKVFIKLNGLNISTGGFMQETEMNGLNIVVITKTNNMNGFSIAGCTMISREINGISIAGIQNLSKKTSGLSVALINKTVDIKGLQIGIYNEVQNDMFGAQIGLINITNKSKGLQLGLININKKRFLPFVNF